MESTEPEHSHYWPGEGVIPITPQAIQFGYVFPVYVTRGVWGDCITWAPNPKRPTNAEKRIFGLLASCYTGMGKKLTTDPDMVFYKFKHWFWHRLRPNATKQTKVEYAARLLLNPETDEPWLLIFHPLKDGEEVLKRGELPERTED